MKQYILIQTEAGIYKVLDKNGTGAATDGRYWLSEIDNVKYIVVDSYLIDDNVQTSVIGKFIEDSDNADELIRKAETLNENQN